MPAVDPFVLVCPWCSPPAANSNLLAFDGIDWPDPLPAPDPEKFMVEATVTVEFRVRADLARLIRDHHDSYHQPLERGFAEYERPMVFLHNLIAAEFEPLPLIHGVDEGDPWGPTIEVDENPDWNQAQFAELVAVCPEADLTPKAEPADPDGG